SRRRHTRWPRDWSSDVCSSDLAQNLIVYSGFSPFVGAGTVIGGWSFAVATDKAKDTFGTASAVTPFRMRQIYAAVAQAIQRLERSEERRVGKEAGARRAGR